MSRKIKAPELKIGYGAFVLNKKFLLS